MPNQRVSPESGEAETASVEAEVVKPDDPDLADMQTADFETDVVEVEVLPPGLPSRLIQGTRRRLAGAATATSVSLKKLPTRAATLARQHPREAAAVVLLVAGAGYPPVWLVGALIAVIATAWERRDLWTGLALPIGIVILGAVLIPAVTPHGSAADYAHSVWLLASRLSRIVAVLSAGYLSWRLHRGPREPKVLPWNNPRMFG